MIDTPIIISTSENMKKSLTLTPILASACTIACYIFIVSTTNCTKIEFPQQCPPDVCIVSTNSARSGVYNSGNIDLCLDGVSAMNTDLLHSYQKITEIECLEDDWNDNGASKFSAEIISTIRNIVERLARQPRIFPTARKSIQFEYENEVGDYLEFELFESGRLKKFYCSNDGKTATEDISIEMIYEAVEKFYGFEI